MHKIAKEKGMRERAAKAKAENCAVSNYPERETSMTKAVIFKGARRSRSVAAYAGFLYRPTPEGVARFCRE